MNIDQPIKVTTEIFPSLGAMDGNIIFYSVTALAMATLLISLACMLHPKLQSYAKQAIFSGLVGGLLTLGLLSTFLMLHVMYYPWSIVLFFSIGFLLFAGVYFLCKLVNNSFASIRKHHA
ncbi:hypothetical protein [Methylophilus sp. OH31]|uniref:hypothetical protein n=1 Tax=Methylophilus sp. OH31 TaxID=1387312 RepID=UPI0004656353|nr:hypothetical protein [Methylophilus sp. OH31]